MPQFVCPWCGFDTDDREILNMHWTASPACYRNRNAVGSE